MVFVRLLYEKPILNNMALGGRSQKNEDCVHNCQLQKELSLVQEDIDCMALEVDVLSIKCVT